MKIGALVLHINITDEVLLEESMAQARSLAEDASLAKSRFLANMSHELRTPLNAIIGFSEMIGQQTFGRHSHPKYREYGKDIRQAAEHLLRMIKQVLDLSKIEAGRLELDERAVDVASRQRSVFKLVKQDADNREVELEAQIPQRLPKLLADEGAIDQILINLIGNALKFTGKRGKITCAASLDKRSGGLQISVSDTGVGIPKEDLERITEPFNQVRSTLTSDNSGVGLGLSLVSSLARVHQATVDIDSEVGKGTSVRVNFPASRVIDAIKSEDLRIDPVSAGQAGGQSDRRSVN